jgi:hypothetical protein
MSELDWLRLISKSITEDKLVTKRKDPKNRHWEFEKTPNYRTWELIPSQKLDKGKSYLISGTDSSVMNQASLIKALHEILGDRLGYAIDFDNWFEDFSYEFKYDPITEQFREGSEANNPDEISKLKFWGVNKDERPKFKWITPAKDETDKKKLEDYHKLGYSVIKFWKNRSKDTEWIFITGTLTELRQNCLDEMKTVNVDSKGFTSVGGFVSNKGKPKVVLYFIEPLADVEVGYQQIEARLSFRLSDLSERWDTPNLENLTLADIEQLAIRIKTEFNTPTPYKIRKGKITVSYRDKANGLESYSYFYNKQDGIAFYQKMCLVAGKTFNLKFCKVTECQDELSAYPIIPPEEKVLGETVRSERIRPMGDVYFFNSLLFLSSLTKPIPLYSQVEGLFNASDFDISKYKRVPE